MVYILYRSVYLLMVFRVQEQGDKFNHIIMTACLLFTAKTGLVNVFFMHSLVTFISKCKACLSCISINPGVDGIFQQDD